MEVHNDNDLVQYYQQLQSMVIMYNIFLQEFALLQPWQKSATTIPTTCMLTNINVETNTIDAYRRMKTALYIKLTKTVFHNAEHKAIVQHGAIEQDGFEILYDLMTHCHPRLMNATIKYRKVNTPPTFTSKDSIYSFCTNLKNWLEIEHINNHHYSDDDLLNMVIEQLREDTRFDIAVAGIQSELTMQDMMIRQVGSMPFPESLLLCNLPATIMPYYTASDKQQLFPMDTTATLMHQLCDMSIVDTNAVVNSYKRSNQRELIDKFCQGCGQFGHNVYHNGCDFCAKLLLANNFLKKHPNVVDKIKSDYRDHQKLHREERKQKDNNKYKSSTATKKGPAYKTRSKAKVRVLVNALNEVLSESDESSSDNEFVDAQDDSAEHKNIDKEE